MAILYPSWKVVGQEVRTPWMCYVKVHPQRCLSQVQEQNLQQKCITPNHPTTCYGNIHWSWQIDSLTWKSIKLSRIYMVWFKYSKWELQDHEIGNNLPRKKFTSVICFTNFSTKEIENSTILMNSYKQEHFKTLNNGFLSSIPQCTIYKKMCRYHFWQGWRSSGKDLLLDLTCTLTSYSSLFLLQKMKVCQTKWRGFLQKSIFTNKDYLIYQFFLQYTLAQHLLFCEKMHFIL